MITASASAKVILFGEHAVVYKQPAIAVPISSLRTTATASSNQQPQRTGLWINTFDLDEEFQVDFEPREDEHALAVAARLVLHELDVSPPDVTIAIESAIPLASGLGSGTAATTCLARGLISVLGLTLNHERLNEIVYEIEKIHHGTPSGIDNTVIVYERPVFFVRGHPIEILSIGRSFTLIVADTGKSASTKVAVGDVRKLFENQPEQIQPIFDDIGQISRAAKTAIVSGEIETLGPLMVQNHSYLRKLAVSSLMLDKLVNVAMEAGALGAKLTGGGRGGNMIALVESDTIESVRRALLKAGAVRAVVSTIEASTA